MIIKSKNKKLWSRGQTATEFAFIASVFLMLTLSIISIGRVIYAYDFVSYVAREATRYAAVHGSQSKSPAAASDITNLVKAGVHGFDPSGIAVTTTWTPDNKPGSLVKVQVQYTWSFRTPFVNFAPLTLSSTSQMVIDN